MIKIFDLLKEIVVEKISNTDLGQEIHYVIEAKESIDEFKGTAYEHIIKLVMIRDPYFKEGWINTVKKDFQNILRKKWIIDKLKKPIQQIPRDIEKRKQLLQPTFTFEDHFDSAKNEYKEEKLRKEQEGFKNLPDFPITYTDNQIDMVNKIYNKIIGDLIISPKPVNFYVNIPTIINNILK
jgi:hypothetical protein